VESGDGRERLSGAGHAQRHAAAEAVADGGHAFRVDLRLLLEHGTRGVEPRLHGGGVLRRLGDECLCAAPTWDPALAAALGERRVSVTESDCWTS
jgi:hypothetical protein